AYPCPDCEAFIFVADAAGNTVMRTLRLIANFPESRALDSLTLVSLLGETGYWNWQTGDPLDQWGGVTVTGDRVTGLEIGSSGLTGALRLGRLTALTTLGIYDNYYITALDVRGCTALTTLDCHWNDIKTLYANGCAALTHLDCSENYIAVLDVRGCTALTELNCNWNYLHELDVHDNVLLAQLHCAGNNLTALDVSNHAVLEELHCDNNSLESLAVSGCPALKFSNCSSNQFESTALDALFNALPDRTGEEEHGTIQIGNNPGTDGCTKTIAEGKNWTVDT
ncbi:MAG: hypothetical protein LBN98_05285, partial [Prevotellaceae bacterium]|nr:hypothetical protein [Prevotellaceae bacterium]